MHAAVAPHVSSSYVQDGTTPLMFAVRVGHLDVVRTLVENGRADVNIGEGVSLLYTHSVTN